eukprot:m.557996 g.557996  ORF g.557996 m.557996 type:complete len:626 (+) comp22195_c0_seq1:114-1991(+)
MAQVRFVLRSFYVLSIHNMFSVSIKCGFLIATILQAMFSLTGAHSKPHIIYILTDNLGFGNVGYLRAQTPAGPSPEIVTPTLDNLAETGIQLHRFYTYKFCAPSRASLISGRWPIHVNHHNVGLLQPGFGIPENMTTMPRFLKNLGYSTHHVGKWHLGFSTPRKTPLGRGFDSSLGYLFAYNDYLHGFSEEGCENTTLNGTFPGKVNYTNTSESHMCTSRSIAMRHLHYFTDLWQSGTSDEGPAYNINGTGFEEGLFVNRVNGIIDGHDASNTDHPLFLYYAMHMLHSPLCVPEEFLDRFSFITDNEDRRYVSAMMLYADHVIDSIVTNLKENGLWANTLFIWTSDNGAAIELDTGAKSAYPLRGGYYTNQDGGVRAPALVNGGILPATMRGKTLSGLMHLCDWLPTLVLGAAGGTNVTDPATATEGLPVVDGINMWPYLTGEVDVSPRSEVIFTPLAGDDVNPHAAGNALSGYDPALISGRYKLILGVITQASWTGDNYPNGTRLPSAPPGQCYAGEQGCWDTWATVLNCSVPPLCTPYVHGTSELPLCKKIGCLFDVYADPGEHRDLAAELPEVVETMYRRMVAINASVYDPDRGSTDAQAACDVMIHKRHGFWGPWLESSYP